MQFSMTVQDVVVWARLVLLMRTEQDLFTGTTKRCIVRYER
jgi:hypothetical protein